MTSKRIKPHLKTATAKQLMEEFKISKYKIFCLKRGDEVEYKAFLDAWLYRLICSKVKKQIVKQIPSPSQLEKDYPNIKPQYKSIYVDAWNFRRVMLQKLKRKTPEEGLDIDEESYICNGLNNTSVTIPTNSQIAKACDLSKNALNLMHDTEKVSLYEEAWLYETIISHLDYEDSKEIEVISPNTRQLVDEFSLKRQNAWEHIDKNTKSYKLYTSVYGLRYSIAKKL